MAFFENGRTGERVAVDLRSIDKGLEIRDRQDGLMLALWAYGDIIPHPRKNRRRQGLCLGSRSDPADRLFIDDPSLIERLKRSAPALRSRHWQVRRRLLAAALGLVVFILGLAVLYEAILLGAKPLALAMPAAWDQALGRRLAARLVAGYGGACRTPDGLAALADLEQRFSQNTPAGRPLILQVVKSAHLNAFILPGGQVILTSGLVRESGTADEMAAAVAFLLAHGLAGHATEQTLHHAGLGLVLLLAGDRSTDAAEISTNPLPALAFTRQEAREADTLARQILEQAAIPAQALGNFFRRLTLKEKSTGQPVDFLSSHPMIDRRTESGPIPPFTRPALTDGQWASLRAICG